MWQIVASLFKSIAVHIDAEYTNARTKYFRNVVTNKHESTETHTHVNIPMFAANDQNRERERERKRERKRELIN